MSISQQHERGPSREATVAMGPSLIGQGLPLPSVAGGRVIDQADQGIEANRAAALARADQERAKTDLQRDPAKVAAAPAVGGKGNETDQLALSANAGEIYEGHIRMVATREGEVGRKDAANMSLSQIQSSMGDSKKSEPKSNEWMAGWDKGGIGAGTFQVSSVSQGDTGTLPPPPNNAGQQRSQEPAIARLVDSLR